MQPSQLQQTYPLSSKKYLKKILKGVFGGASVGILPLLVPLIILGSLFWNSPGFGPAISLVVTVLLIILILGIAGYAWYVQVYIQTYYYESDANFLTIRKGVFTPTEIHVQYPKIQDVYVDQDLLDRMFGIYDVHIASATATSGIEAHIDGLDGPVAEALKEFLLGQIQSHSASNLAPAAPVQTVLTSTPAQTLSATSVQTPAVNQTHISSDQYPIQPRWLTKMVIQTVIGSVVGGGLAIMYVWNSLTYHTQSPAISTDTVVHWCIVLIIVGVVFQVVYYRIWAQRFRFELSDDYILSYTSVISTNEQHIPYKAVQDVMLKQGIFDRIFGLTNVVIQNAANNAVAAGSNAGALAQSGITIPGQNASDAQLLADTIKQIVLTKGSQQMGL